LAGRREIYQFEALRMTTNTAELAPVAPVPEDTSTSHQAHPFLLPVVGAAAFSHLLNDLIQAVLPSVYPMLKTQFSLSFAQIGWIALVYQVTASLLQPWIGMYTDKHPKPYLLPSGMVVTFIGIALLAFAGSYEALLVASAVVGVGSATFHPEASRVARMASGGRFGTAQSTFQVGGNTGSAIGPLLAAAIVIPYGQHAIAWFMLAAALAIFVLSRLTAWTIRHGQAKLKSLARNQVVGLNRAQVIQAIVVIAILMFAKFVYIAAFTNYFTFYLIHHFGIPVAQAQLHLFAFLVASAAGGFLGGPLGDRIGRKPIIWTSILGVAPFALMLPHADLFWTTVLAVLIGFVLSSAFSAIVVYAQEMMPHRIGMVSGLFFGFAFGMGGLGAAVLGLLADKTSIEYVYQLTAFLPLLGIVAAWLPPSRPAAH